MLSYDGHNQRLDEGKQYGRQTVKAQTTSGEDQTPETQQLTSSTAALTQFRASEHAKDVRFTVKYLPFQLYPEASKEGEDKYEWYRRSRYGDSEDKMKMYETLMTAYGAGVGIKFKFHGTVANTIDSHRFIQHFQEERGPETADKLVNCMIAIVPETSTVLTHISTVFAVLRKRKASLQ